MSKKTYIRLGETYYPQKKETKVSDKEVIGGYWRAWQEGNKYFFEYDAGYFETKFKTVEITEDDFLSIKSGKITDHDLAIKYDRIIGM